jgi:molybdopterin synthase catalytic subunit
MQRHCHVAVQEADFDLGVEVAALRADDAGTGAIASFVGTVRGDAGNGGEPTLGAPDGVRSMWLEHYPGMTEAAIHTMCEQAFERFALRGVRVIHRVGRLRVGEQIVLVAVSSAHRAAAFQGCEFLMDYLKTQAPFWKKEGTAEGERWVSAREADDAALLRWGVRSENAA